MIQVATIATLYIGSGTEKDPYRPATFDLLQPGESAEDITGTPGAEIAARPTVTIRMRAEKTRFDAIDSPEHRVLERTDLELIA